MNWQKDKLTIIGFGIIFVILGVFGYLLWDMGRDTVVNTNILETPIGESPSSEISTPIVEEKNKVRIYTEESKLDENGYDFDVKVLRSIDGGEPELLTTIELRDANVSQFIPYNIELSPDRQNILLSYETGGSDILQLLNIDTKEIQDITRVGKDLNISSPTFSPDSKQVFFLQSTPKYSTGQNPIRLTVTYDFNLFTIVDKKNEVIKTVRTRSEINTPRWLPNNQILLSYALETTRENPESRYELYTLNLGNKEISTFSNTTILNPPLYNNLFNQDNSLFTKPKTFTTKEFEKCFDDAGTLPNSYTIIETISGKEITSFKGSPEEPVLPIKFSPNNKEILYRLAGEGCNVNDNVKYYVQSLYDDKPREEIKLDDIIKEWDIIFDGYGLGTREIIFYQ